jgi:ABC-type sugar transport system ATPase subunit
MIAARGLSVQLGDFSLNDVTIEVADGEYFVILGPTGAGKTILIETLAGLHHPLSGEVWMDGKNVTT